MKHRKWLMIIIIAGLLALFLVMACRRKLEVHQYEINAAPITEPIRFAILTDLHSSPYRDNMQELITAVTQQQPDAVFLVGDIFDNHFENTNSWTVVTALAQQYPCYYVTGNHEQAQEKLPQLLDQLTQIGVHVLQGTSHTIEHAGTKIRICGVDDALAKDHLQQIHAVTTELTDADYHILLSHRPDNIGVYGESGADLVISGHAHGGQWRIPFIIPNGLYAPHQGILPRYTGGLYEFETWKLLVSRGLDKQSVKLPRIFNRPEILVLTLK